MSLQRVSIVGRPNVGKSSLLNRIAGRRVSIVEPTAGVTRDRVAVTCAWQDHHFELVGWPETTVIIRFWLIAAISVGLALGIFIADFSSLSTG